MKMQIAKHPLLLHVEEDTALRRSQVLAQEDSGYDAANDLTGSSKQERDCIGHGTHCSATAAGKK